MNYISGGWCLKKSDFFKHHNLPKVDFVHRGTDQSRLFLKKHLSFLQERVLFCFYKEGVCTRVKGASDYELSDITFEEFEARLSSPSSPYLMGIWYDEKDDRLLVFRDFFGKIPFFYFKTDDLIIFSTDYSELVNSSWCKNRLTPNEDLIYRYLSPSYTNARYTSDTFFKEIKAVMPGYLTDLSSESSKYILDFSDKRYQDLSTLVEYGGEFKELFQRSVARCVEGTSNISSQLSGGLDSSSITCMVRQLRPDERIVGLHMTAGESPDSDLPKNHDITYAKEVAYEKTVDLHFFPVGREKSKSFLEVIRALGQPPFAIGVLRTQQLLSEVKKRGCDLMLTGSLGDSVVGYGEEYLEDLVRRRKWKELGEGFEALAKTDRYLGIAKIKGKPAIQLVKVSFFKRSLTKFLVNRKYKDFVHLLIVGGIKLKVNSASLLAKILINRVNRISYNNERMKPIIPQQFLHSTTSSAKDSVPLLGQIHVNQTIRLMEDYYAMARLTGIKIDHPFCDAALFELSESVPPKEKFYHGLGRGQLREGMKGILTESVRIRSNKTSPDSNLTSIWIRDLVQNCTEELLSPTSGVWKYVDYEAFFHNYRLFETGKLPQHKVARIFFDAYRVVLLSAWLKNNNL